MNKKKLLFLSLLPLAISLCYCQKSSEKDNKGYVVPNNTPTPSGKEYQFDDIDVREKGKEIVISNEEQLFDFARMVNDGNNETINSYVKLVNDISLKKEWTPIAGFKGQFNGEGHTIKGLKIKNNAIRQGFFSYLDGAKIGCLKIDGEINAKDNSAIVAGYTLGDCSFVNITTSGHLTSTSNVGGLVGIITNGSVNIKGCVNKAYITGSGFVGGLVGVNNTYKINVSDSANYGQVIGNGSYVGGIIAMLTNNTAIENDYDLVECFNYGEVRGKTYTAGVVGLSCAPLKRCGVGFQAKTFIIINDKLEEAKTLLSFNMPFCATLCGGILRNVSNNALGELIECKNQDGFAITGINDPAGCTRVIKYKDRVMLFAATNKYAVSYDGGHTFGPFTTISGKADEKCPIDGSNSSDTGNTQPYVLPDGRIIIMYRAIKKADDYSYGSLRMRISDYDGNFNPNDEPIIMIENYTSVTGTPGAFYEPYPLLLDDGTIAVYISEDVHYSDGYGQKGDALYIPKLPDELICGGGSQDTVMLRMRIPEGATEVLKDDEEDDGTKIKFFEPKLVFRGSDLSMFGHSNSRPGMTVLTELYDGSYAMILENSTEQMDPGYNLVVQMTFSKDGLNWTTPRTIIRPLQTPGTTNGNNQKYKTCAPFVTTLPDGRLVVVCATDERYEGYYPTDDAHYKHEIAFVTKERIGYIGEKDPIFSRDDCIQLGNYYYNENEYCVWASVAQIDGRIYISGLEGVNGLKDDGTVSSPTQWILLSTIDYQDLYSRLGLEEIK